MRFPLGTTITSTQPTTTTVGQGLSKRMVAIAAGAMMLVAYGAVVMLQGGSLYTTAAEGLVVFESHDDDYHPGSVVFDFFGFGIPVSPN